MIDLFGFVANPRWSTFRNLVAVIADMPSWLYFDRPSNTAFHNLTIDKKLPPGTRALLGLGLGFCPTPRHSTTLSSIDMQRFRANLKLRMFFNSGEDTPVPKLYIRSNWEPPNREFTPEFIDRIFAFQQSVQATITPRSTCRSNLLRLQRLAFTKLRHDNTLHVFKTDKNLGPAIIEKEIYIRRALDEHLSDTTTYGRLHEFAADHWMEELRDEISTKIINQLPRGNERTFLQRALARVTDPFGYFYLLAKVHKNPWKTRPIISISGSMLHGLGRWVDMCLQHIVDTLPYVCRSSYHLSQDLRDQNLQSADIHLFTMDAVSMYTNIDTDHALTVIGDYVRTPEATTTLQNHNIAPDILLTALSIIMRNNVFKFGDTYWYQKTGTAMGTPPAPPYATLYFAIHEMNVLPKHPNLLFYRRLIDDGFGVWKGNAKEEFTKFQSDINNYGKLTWEFSPLQESVNFLDLTITVDTSSPPTYRLDFCLYEKAMNLYLYLPPHSAHPPGILKGLIYGMILRMKRLTSNESLLKDNVIALYRRLRQRGYNASTLLPIFYAALSRANSTERPREKKHLLFFHLPFHPSDPPASTWRKCFRSTIGLPKNRQPLSLLRGSWNSRRPFGDYRFIVAYSRQPTLGNLLSPRRLRAPSSVTIFVDTLDRADPIPGNDPNLNPTGTRASGTADIAGYSTVPRPNATVLRNIPRTGQNNYGISVQSATVMAGHVLDRTDSHLTGIAEAGTLVGDVTDDSVTDAAGTLSVTGHRK